MGGNQPDRIVNFSKEICTSPFGYIDIEENGGPLKATKSLLLHMGNE